MERTANRTTAGLAMYITTTRARSYAVRPAASPNIIFAMPPVLRRWMRFFRTVNNPGSSLPDATVSEQPPARLPEITLVQRSRYPSPE